MARSKVIGQGACAIAQTISMAAIKQKAIKPMLASLMNSFSEYFIV
jgi:hypothetical protein